MINREDLKIDILSPGDYEPAAIEPGGYRPGGRIDCVMVRLKNTSGLAIKWCNVDVALDHTETTYHQSFYSNFEAVNGRNPFSNTHYSVRGTELQTIRFNRSIQVGVSKVVSCSFASQFAHQEGVKNLPSGHRVVRLYGEDASGDKFMFELQGGAVLPLAITKRSCFIATAAFDGDGHPVVDELRRVRDEMLKRTRSGRAFIKFYYRHSPRIAAWMADRPRVKRATRAILTPLARSTRALSAVRRGGWRSLFQNKL